MARTGRKNNPKQVSLAEAGGAQFIEIEVDAPFAKGKRERVKAVFRPKTMEWFAANGHLKEPGEAVDGTESRMIAYRKFCSIHDSADTGAAGIDYSRIKVDTSPRYDGTPARVAEAISELTAIGRAIGYAQKGLLERIMGGEYAVADLALAYRCRNCNAHTMLYADIRSALDGLLEYFGVARGRQNVTKRANL